MFEDKWYRARVLDPTPEGIIVQYIEFGNVEMLQPNDMLPASNVLKFDVFAREFIIDSEFTMQNGNRND